MREDKKEWGERTQASVVVVVMEPYTLLVWMQNGSVDVENSMEVLQK